MSKFVLPLFDSFHFPCMLSAHFPHRCWSCDSGAIGDGTDADTTSDCAACSNLSEVQMLALAAYPGGAKRVVCDPDCLDGVDVLDCDCEPRLLP